MDEPVYGTTMEETWQRLPEHFRRMDALNDWSLKRYLNTVVAQLQVTDDLVDRIDYDSVGDGGEPGATSDLVDPRTADATWLPWLGQLFGVHVRGKGQEKDRNAVIQAASGFNAGTPAAIEAAAKEVLVGSQFSKVYNFSTSSGIGTGTFWDLLLVTIDSETLKNLYSELQATLGDPVSWTIQPSVGYTANRRIAKVAQNVYNNSAMELSFTGTAGNISTVTITSPKASPITPTDWYQMMLTLWSNNGASYSGTIGITYYNSSGTNLGTTTQAITVTGNPTQFVVGVNAPASSASASVTVVLNTVASTDKIYVAQLAARHEQNDYWIPKTADPVQAVIDRGAKPAGFKLWYTSATSSWNDVLADHPTWADWEGKTWTELEEPN